MELTLRDWLAIVQFVIMIIGFILILAKVKFQTDANTKEIEENKKEAKETFAAHKTEVEQELRKIETEAKQCIERVDSALRALAIDVKEIREANYGQVLISLDRGITDLKSLLSGCIWNKYRPDEFVKQSEIKEYPTRKEVVHLIADKVQHAGISGEKQG